MLAQCALVRSCRMRRRLARCGLVALWAAQRGCSSPGTSSSRKNAVDSEAPLCEAVAAVPPDSLFELEGLREYRDRHLRPLLDEKRRQLRSVTAVKAQCEAAARWYPDYYAAALFVLLSAQAATLFYWVYFLFDWNLVEPVTYLLGYGGVWVGIACYGATRREFTYDACREMITAYHLRRLYCRHHVDVALWQQLVAEVELLETQVRGLEGV
ncbi:hypothetical protein DQ04_05021030 [Trypanosoma grayi]|uniref:hypothetical protein n=1 Tax=Trypanosoma grayi TaxID=71804 RepID=UPI0004F46C20|nr:hypothetical protein DQ04_05021030 [Trypanosoma grayi]KEG09564.1 hypothetical protein DQ04_05021030 [Trypanosoma grayi]